MIVLNPAQHHIRRVPISEWLEREFEDIHLFVIWNSHARVWEICQWIGGDLMVEHHIMEDLKDFDRHSANELRLNIYGKAAALAKVRKDVIADERAGNRESMDKQAEQQDFYNFLARKSRGRSQLLNAMGGATA